MKCPRRDESPRPDFPEGEDEWRADDTCSYCGSCSPEAFLAACATGRLITPTDKSYKAYVDLPTNSHGKFYFQHLDHDQKGVFCDLLNGGNGGILNLAFPGRFYVTPYFLERVPAPKPDGN